MNKTLHDIADAQFEPMLRDLRASISIPSTLDEAAATKKDPFGPKVSAALEQFLACAASLGFETKNIENAAGWAEIGSGDTLVGILAHLDVVPVGDLSEWKYPPFAAEVADGALWGRGVADDKGPAFAALYALKAASDAGVLNGKRFRVIVGGDEESGSRCMRRYKETEEIPAYSFSPDSSFPLINAEKGMAKVIFSKKIIKEEEFADLPALVSLAGGFRYNVVPDRAEALFEGLFPEEEMRRISEMKNIEVRVEGAQTRVKAFGKTAHAMAPHTGENALLTLFAAVGRLMWKPVEAKDFVCDMGFLFADTYGKEAGIAKSDELSGPLTWNAAIADVTPKHAELKVDIRYPVTVNWDELCAELKNAAKRADAELVVDIHSAPLFVDPKSPLVEKLLKAYKNVTGIEAQAESTGGGTYCRSIPNAVSFGPNFPGEPDLDHQPNEMMTLANLRKLLHLYAEAVALLAE